VDDLQSLGRILLVVGVLVTLVGGALALGLRIPFLGQLPGDITIDRENVRVFVPLGTMVVLSLILTVILNLLNRSR
jgi:Protein of unknown function (DUF2905)